MEIERSHLLLKHPFTLLIAGATGSGKSVLTRRLLQHGISLERPKVIWAYGIFTEAYNTAVAGVDIHYVEGLPSHDEINEIKPNIIVLDDLMSDLGNNKKLANFFTRDSHHMNFSVIFIVQNVFHQGSQMRNISLNSHYIILMKNARDKQQVLTLARQIYPTNAKHLIEAFEDATKDAFGYLLIDLTGSTPDKFRLRTEVANEKGYFAPVIYISR